VKCAHEEAHQIKRCEGCPYTNTTNTSLIFNPTHTHCGSRQNRAKEKYLIILLTLWLKEDRSGYTHKVSKIYEPKC